MIKRFGYPNPGKVVYINTLDENKTLINEELLRIINLEDMDNLSISNKPNSVGIKVVNSEKKKYLVYKTNEVGMIEYVKEYESSQKALYNALAIYRSLIVDEVILGLKKGRR